MPEYRIENGVTYGLTTDHRSVIIDLAGTGGAIGSGSPIVVAVRDHDLNLIRYSSGVAVGVGTDTNCWCYFDSLSGIFPDYDGSKDVLSVVVTTTGSLDWSNLGVGPRIIRHNSTFTENNDVLGFRSVQGTDRTVGALITGASASIYVNSGVYDVRSISATFTPGATVAGWTSTAPVDGTQITPSSVQSRRASVYVATQNDASLLSLGTSDKLSFGLSSQVGALTSTITQSGSGVTFDLGTSSMTVRYVHVFQEKGE